VKVLIIGKGGREHALAWKLRQSPRVDQVFIAPGNGGTAREGLNVPIDAHDTRGLLQFAKKESIGLTVVGPEDPLVAGIVDSFQREGLRIFGPKKDAAELEGSKVFAKDLMRQAGIPTADYRVFRNPPDAEQYVLSREVSLVVRSRGRSTIRHTQLGRTALETLELVERILDPREMLAPGVQVELEEKGQKHVFSNLADARDFIHSRPLALVLKADGLAAGKGVYVCRTIKDALLAIDDLMVRRIFGRAGDRVVIEERLDGQEASILALTDGRTIIPLESAQDHKRAWDGDEGPNTGGMGAYSPAPIASPDFLAQVEREVLVPAVHAMKRSRRAFRGVLYAGLMLTHQGPKVLEFNVRFGDPECQVILMRMKSDLLDLLEAVVDERLDQAAIEWDPRPAVTLVMASEGYPGSYERGRIIHNLDAVDKLPDLKVFHSGTTLRSDPGDKEPRLLTDGGRVLSVTALGSDLRDARSRAYNAARQIRWQGAWFRNDIGSRGLDPA
jgi:phosphoribosylamine--glycine ligase